MITYIDYSDLIMWVASVKAQLEELRKEEGNDYKGDYLTYKPTNRTNRRRADDNQYNPRPAG
jgi:hypothetical protein